MRTKQPLILGAILAALVLVGAGCYSSSSSNSNTSSSSNTPATSTTSAVTISNFSFAPTDLVVKLGTTVTWTNNDSTAHTVTGDNGGPASGQIAPGGTYNYTFSAVGTFNYHCSIHTTMTGTVTVSQ